MQSAAGKAVRVVGGEVRENRGPAQVCPRGVRRAFETCLRMSTLRALNATECAMRYTPRVSSRIFRVRVWSGRGLAPGGAAIAVMRTACLVSYRIRYFGNGDIIFKTQSISSCFTRRAGGPCC